MTYVKTITPHFEQNGKRKNLTGYTGELYDGNILLHSQSYDTNSQAEQALDHIVFDLLTDLAEHGLVDDVPAALEAEMVSSTHLPSWQDNEPIYECPYCARNITPCPVCDSPECRLRINRVILNVTKALHIPCRSCQADHLTQHCPAIRALLLTSPHCSQCGDPMDWSGAGLCHLCRDWSEPVVMVLDVEYAPAVWIA